ncbi:MAG: transposase [Betaproteobacteria bacterium]|nr:transposase [Betaproteobacteria bacterium]
MGSGLAFCQRSAGNGVRSCLLPTQRFNRRHGLVGHLFQGRFKAILVDRDAYLLALCRYVERNPVAAGIVRTPQAWPWSSCRAHLGLRPTPNWLDTDGLYGYLLSAPVAGDADRHRAAARYAELVGQAVESDFWARRLTRQVFLGDEAFAEPLLAALPATQRRAHEVPRVQRSRPLELPQLLQAGMSRDEALHTAYTQGGATMTHLAAALGLSVSRVSRGQRRDVAGSIMGRERSCEAPRLHAAKPTRLADRRPPDGRPPERHRLAAPEEQPLRVHTCRRSNPIRTSAPTDQTDLRAEVR